MVALDKKKCSLPGDVIYLTNFLVKYLPCTKYNGLHYYFSSEKMFNLWGYGLVGLLDVLSILQGVVVHFLILDSTFSSMALS